jgi:hypothetical protein
MTGGRVGFNQRFKVLFDVEQGENSLLVVSD